MRWGWLQKNRLHHVVANQFEILLPQEMLDVALLAGKKVVQADDVVPLSDEAIAQVRAQKTSSARNQNAFD